MMYRVDGKKNMLTSALSPVTNVVAVDDHTVEFTTVQPYPILTAKLKSLAILPVGLAQAPPGNIQYDNVGDCGILGTLHALNLNRAKLLLARDLTS